MNSENVARNTQDLTRNVHPPEATEGKNKNGPSVVDIRQRALEIHNRGGAHPCDLDNYLDAWLQAERELREKHNKNNNVDSRKK